MPLQVDKSGNITNYWEDEGQTKSQSVGNIRDLREVRTKEFGDTVFFPEVGGSRIPADVYARQSGLPKARDPLFSIAGLCQKADGNPWAVPSSKLLVLIWAVFCACQGTEAYPPFMEDRLLTPEERAQVYSEQLRMDELPPQVVQRLRSR